MNEESSEARKTAVLPMSDWLPDPAYRHLICKVFFYRFHLFCGTNLSNAGVSVVPGVITFALIFLTRRSLENPLAK